MCSIRHIHSTRDALPSCVGNPFNIVVFLCSKKRSSYSSVTHSVSCLALSFIYIGTHSPFIHSRRVVLCMCSVSHHLSVRHRTVLIWCNWVQLASTLSFIYFFYWEVLFSIVCQNRGKQHTWALFFTGLSFVVSIDYFFVSYTIFTVHSDGSLSLAFEFLLLFLLFFFSAIIG